MLARDLGDLPPRIRNKYRAEIAAIAAKHRRGVQARRSDRFGERLRAWMYREFVSPQALSRELGVTPGHIHHYITGRKFPSYEKLTDLARFMWRCHEPLDTADHASCEAILSIHHTLFGET